MISKIDYYIAGFIGFFTGVFLIPTVVQLGVRAHAILFFLPLVFPVLIVFGVFISRLLSRWMPFFAQFGKFAAVGILNTSIDFGILNLLSVAFGIASGFIVGGINIPGFVIAIVNSYFLNKLWVFRGGNREHLLYDFPKFLTVTLIGLGINTGIIISGTTFIAPFFETPSSVWLNIIKVFATLFSLIWNFAGFKFFVFVK
ncbi:MAG: GtrA family protein [Candidatus Colwellbacteria bacterium]|nr:GtrA family protein [Candidatus Colwellbacteria bacterium]